MGKPAFCYGHAETTTTHGVADGFCPSVPLGMAPGAKR